MNNRFLGHCMLCHKSPIEVKHINLYVVGGEGLFICHKCEMKLVEIIREIIHKSLKDIFQERLMKQNEN